MSIQVGDRVRIYYEENCFDEGEVKSMIGNIVTVDFYDWIEAWHDDQFGIHDLYYEGVEVLVPVTRGVIVLDYRHAP